MEQLSGLDYVAIEFFKDGSRKNVNTPVYPPGITDLIIISHGWHQDALSSKQMYSDIIGHLVDAAKADWDAKGRKFGVAGIFWPSDKFRDDLGQETFNVLGGQAASTGGDIQKDVLKSVANEVADFLEITDPKFATKAILASNGGGDADDFVDLLRSALGKIETKDAKIKKEHSDLFKKKGSQIQKALKMQPAPKFDSGAILSGNAAAFVSVNPAGQALGLFSGATASIAKILNQFAYFELKRRAAKIGRALGELLNSAPDIGTLRVHLIGHSFGARLMTASTTTLKKPPASMTLIQAAFSQNALGSGLDYPPFPVFDGDFRSVITKNKVNGPIAVTHTWNDKAVGLAYPAASRVSQTIASALKVSNNFGGAKDVYGGMGANGALGLGSDSTQINYNGIDDLKFKPHHVTNLKCDFIQSHTDIRRREISKILKASMA